MTTKIDELKALMARFKAHPELNYPRIQLEVTLRNMAPALIAAVEALKVLNDHVRPENWDEYDDEFPVESQARIDAWLNADAALAPLGENDEQKDTGRA